MDEAVEMALDGSAKIPLTPDMFEDDKPDVFCRLGSIIRCLYCGKSSVVSTLDPKPAHRFHRKGGRGMSQTRHLYCSCPDATAKVFDLDEDEKMILGGNVELVQF